MLCPKPAPTFCVVGRLKASNVELTTDLRASLECRCVEDEDAPPPVKMCDNDWKKGMASWELGPGEVRGRGGEGKGVGRCCGRNGAYAKGDGRWGEGLIE